MINYFKRLNTAFLILALIVIAAISSYLVVLLKVNDDLDDQTSAHLKELSSEMADQVNVKIQERFRVVRAYGNLVMSFDDDTDFTENSTYKAFVEEEGFLSIEIIDYSEEQLTSDRETLVEEQNAEGDTIFCFYVPIENGDEKAMVKAVCSSEAFGSTVSINAFGQNGNTYIIKRDGSLVTDNSLGIHSLDDIFVNDTKYSQRLVSYIQSKDFGSIAYNSGKYKRYICYSKINYNNWYVFSIVSAKIIESSYDSVTERGITLAALMLIVIAILIAYILYFNSRYALYRKIVEERREIYAYQLDNVLFEYKVKHKKLLYAGDIESVLGYVPQDEDIFDEDGNCSVLTEKSYEALKTEIFKKQEDISHKEVTLEIVKIDQSVAEVKVKLTPIFKKNGHLVRIVGSLIK